MIFLFSLLLAIVLAVPAGAQGESSVSSGGASLDMPAVEREFRGVWVATVGNMDWPSRRDLTTEQQQIELLAMLDRAAAMNLNAVIFQVRPAADAFYQSELEPWSEFLTGRQGEAPEPFYDPLAFAITEAHRRGLELHAWFNPFRAGFVNGRSPAAATHISRKRPQLVRRYGSYLWMDPGERAVHDHALAVVRDVVRRYDVDAVHVDDYFYPYQARDGRGRLIDFPDAATYRRYTQGGGKLSRADWRRQNVDRFVERLYDAVKAEKPWVKVGVSPFGIWRPGYPAQVRGLDAYSSIYADARKWMHNGWLDYLAPQLYWRIGQHQQSYPVLLRWWVEQNRTRRHVWPGNFTSRVGNTHLPGWTPSELVAQVQATRNEPGASGNVHFSMSAFMQNRNGLVPALSARVYSEPALVPASPWLGSDPPVKAELSVVANGARDELRLGLDAPEMDRVRHWILRSRYGGEWSVRIVPGVQRSYTLFDDSDPRGLPDIISLSAVDRIGKEGPAEMVARGGRW